MKKLTYLLFIAVGAMGCSVESLDSTENLLTADASMKVIAQENHESFNFPEVLCPGVEAEFCLEFPQATTGNGEPKETNVQVQLYDAISDDYNQIFQGNYNTTACFPYTFDTSGTYSVRYKIGNDWTDDNIIVGGDYCEQSCESGYMIGDKSFSEIGTSNNWGWAHEFNFEEAGSESREIHQKNSSLEGEVTISWDNGTIEIKSETGVNITHIYVSDEEPMTTNAPGQFDKNQTYQDEDGTFWVMIKAEVCE